MSGDSWDYWYPGKESEVEPEIPKLVEVLQSKGFMRILDFGCGTGRHTLYLARSGFRVHAFDASTSAVERATLRLQDEGLYADLRVHDMLKRRPYQDQFFDAIVATRVIHHTLIENIGRIAAEINRVLKNGGYLFLKFPTSGAMNGS